MRDQLTTKLLTVVVTACTAILAGCSPAPTLTRDDVVGTWALDEGGQVAITILDPDKAVEYALKKNR